MHGKCGPDNAQVRGIKETIVRAYKNGNCGPNGEHVPNEQKGRVGKGCHYGPNRFVDDRPEFLKKICPVPCERATATKVLRVGPVGKPPGS